MRKRILVRWPHILLVGLIAVAVYGCLKVDDGITGLDSSAKSIAVCMQQCVGDANDARAAEQRLHRETVRDCAGDPECLVPENARHSAEMQSIAEDERLCKAACHNQGGGQGGE